MELVNRVAQSGLVTLDLETFYPKGEICSADAIISKWAYMLVATHAAPFAADIVHSTAEQLPEIVFWKKIAALDIAQYAGKRMVVEGCSDQPVSPRGGRNAGHFNRRATKPDQKSNSSTRQN
jgi:hypothetical protein